MENLVSDDHCAATFNDQNNSVEFTLGAKKAVVLAGNHKASYFAGEKYSVIVIGDMRAYGKDKSLSAEDVEGLYQGDVGALYPQISGQFVAAIFEHENNTLHVLNDHLASIPVYYTETDTHFYISTNLPKIEAALAEPFTLSSQALYHYCYFHCIPAPTTIYKGVSKAMPAEHICFTEQQIKHLGNLYVPTFVNKTQQQQQKQQQCLDEIEWAVGLYTKQNSGAFLSGGLDSSTVSGMLAKLTKKARTFSVGFNEPGYDETEFAMITANHFGTDHDAAYLEADYIADNFANVAASFDEPFGNSSALAAYFCASYAKGKGIDTMLAGDGGDELFAGNSRYAKQKLFGFYENAPSPVKGLLKAVFVNSPIGKLPLAKKVNSYIQQAENPLPDRLQAYNFLHRFSPSEIFTESFLADVNTELPLEQLRERYQQTDSDSSIDKMLYMDWKFTLADNDLIKVSKMCEKADVEVKFPLIEKELVDFSCAVSADVKLPGQKLRHFFKESMKDFLSPKTLTKSKHGFGLPFGRWMRNTPALVSTTENALNQLKERNIVKPEFIDKALEMQSEQHSAYYGELIWILSVLELWLSSRDR